MYYGSGIFPFFYDPTYILVILGGVIAAFASYKVNSAYNKYSRIRNSSGITGYSAARTFLMNNGVNNTTVEEGDGYLTDHFNSMSHVVRLSQSNFSGNSIAAVAIAAHECGHVLQHERGYFPLAFRTAMFPIVNIATYMSWPIFFIGVIVNAFSFLMPIGIILFSASVVFHLVTLPVEINASVRGMKLLRENNILSDEREFNMAKKVLTAAALTYLAALISSLLQLLRLIIIANERRND